MSTSGYEVLRDLFKMTFDDTDQWGSVQEWRFALAEVLTHRFRKTPEYFVDSLMHRAELQRGEWMPESYADELVADAASDGMATQDDLAAFLAVLDKCSRYLRAVSEDY